MKLTHTSTALHLQEPRNDKTSEGNFDPQFPTFTITSKPRPDNDFVRYTSYEDTLPESVVTPTVKGEV